MQCNSIIFLQLQELLRTHLHLNLPAAKVEELYAKLNKKNAEVYIQRSKQIMNNSPPRTTLFAWSMVNVEIMVILFIFLLNLQFS